MKELTVYDPMSQNSKNKQNKSASKKKLQKKRAKTSRIQKLIPTFYGFAITLRVLIVRYMKRRPHQSFRLTRRRDYIRTLSIPGYWGFTREFFFTVKKFWKALALTVAFGIIAVTLTIGFGSEDTFAELQATLLEAGESIFENGWSEIGQSSALALASFIGTITPNTNTNQQAVLVLIGIIIWLTVVWYIRQSLAGKKVRFRDALYRAGSPLVATILLFIVALAQLVPAIIAMVVITAASGSGILAGGVEAMLAWLAAIGLITLSLYWVSSTLLAMVIVTIPGTYPMKAYSIAGDLVAGRRLKLLFRLLWFIFGVILAWLIILTIIILLNTWLKEAWEFLAWIPIVPFANIIIGVSVIVLAAVYVYMLYRRLVESE